MMEKMVQSKNYEIYQQILEEKQARIEGVGDVKEESASELDEKENFEIAEEQDEEGSMLGSGVSDDDRRGGGRMDEDFKKRLRKLKPSGVQFSLYIDPD